MTIFHVHLTGGISRIDLWRSAHPRLAGSTEPAPRLPARAQRRQCEIQPTRVDCCDGALSCPGYPRWAHRAGVACKQQRARSLHRRQITFLLFNPTTSTSKSGPNTAAATTEDSSLIPRPRYLRTSLPC